jgi:hypothetical protein
MMLDCMAYICRASRETFDNSTNCGWISWRAKKSSYPTANIIWLRFANLSTSSLLRGLKNATRSCNCSTNEDSDIEGPLFPVSISSHVFRLESASSFLALWPLHVLCIRLEAFSFSRSCCRCCLSCWACATVFWVPDAEGVQEPAANGFKFWPERLTCRGRRELPLNVWNIIEYCCAYSPPSLTVIYLRSDMPEPTGNLLCKKKTASDEFLVPKRVDSRVPFSCYYFFDGFLWRCSLTLWTGLEWI